MKLPPILCHLHARRGLPPAAAALIIASAIGCASPGLPRPPSLNLPEVVKDLTVERVGDVVQMQWTTPSQTTDHLDIKGSITAEICRITVSPTPPTPTCVPVVTRLSVQPGPTHASEALPPLLTSDPPALLSYRVQIFNSHSRSAGPSPEAFTASGAAPTPVEQLRATPTRDGGVLEWQQKDTAAVVELDRLPIGPDGVVIEPSPSKPTSKSGNKLTIKKPADKPQRSAATPKPLNAAPSTPIEEKLRTPAQLPDAGGTIDHTAQMGSSYRYTARRVRFVTLAGHTVELRSFPSPPVTLTMTNTFPPLTPTGLEAVPGGATPSDRSIDLSWTPNTDHDLAGYFVYRQEIDSKGVAAGTAARLNATPVVGPAYRDQTAMAGHRYAYRVTAVDAAGNESAPSNTVQETLREQ